MSESESRDACGLALISDLRLAILGSSDLCHFGRLLEVSIAEQLGFRGQQSLLQQQQFTVICIPSF